MESKKLYKYTNLYDEMLYVYIDHIRTDAEEQQLYGHDDKKGGPRYLGPLSSADRFGTYEEIPQTDARFWVILPQLGVSTKGL